VKPRIIYIFQPHPDSQAGAAAAAAAACLRVVDY